MKNRELTPLGREVKKALIDRNMSQAQLADAVGTSPMYLNLILYGDRSGKKYLPAIAEILEIDPGKIERLIA